MKSLNGKALANEDTFLPTQMRATFVADTNFVSATNVSQFAQPKEHHEQQCVRNNVSSFARAFSNITSEDYDAKCVRLHTSRAL